MTTPIRFDDGAAYERYMGVWSQLVGADFLEWLSPPPGQRWLDVGCGNGAFTELMVARGAPAEVTGVDPSEAQLAYARTRPALQSATWRVGSAMALPFDDHAFDAAVMPLVIFFVPDPAVGVAEMARVVAPGGLVSAYAWDMEGGGFPYAAVHTALEAMGVSVAAPPRPEASRFDVLQALWSSAGLEDVDTRAITVQRTFADFDEYWDIVRHGPSVVSTLAALAPDEQARLITRLHAQMREHAHEHAHEHAVVDAAGRLTYQARAHAIRGRVPRVRGAVIEAAGHDATA